MNRYIKYILLCATLLLSQKAFSQLTASFFTSSINGQPQIAGCAPLILRMNEASTGTTNPTTWFWQSSSGSTSNLQNPIFGFVNAGTYTITLFITSGAVTDSTTRTVTVYPNPVVDFDAAPRSGCSGFNTCFTDLTTSPNFPVVEWTWDFGDGNVSQGVQNPCHSYVTGTNPCFNVTLVTTNNVGCSATGQKNNFICLTQAPTVNFTATPRIACAPPYTISFADSSIATNGLSYLWDFGDGNSSTLRNPVHTYLNSGNFNVRLTVTDTVCSQTSTSIRNSFIRTTNLLSNPRISDDTICLSQPIQFTDSSIGTPTTWLWNFGNGVTSNQRNPSYVYPTPGNYIVTLTVTNAIGCTDDSVLTFPIVVQPIPSANITANNTNSCQAPFLVSFNSNASASTTAYNWDFGDGNFSNNPNPTNNYLAPGNYNVVLIVENALGCRDTVTQSNFIRIEPTIVNFTSDSTQGCAPLNICFRDSSISLDPIISRQWDFGDPISGANNTSTLLNPCHLFQNVGVYNVTLTATTQGGCIATTTRQISAGTAPSINFSVSSTTVCAGIPVQFTNLSTGTPPPNSFLWQFDASGSAATADASFAWDEPGQYTVTFTVRNNGCSKDSTVQITVLDPRPDFTFAANCNIPGRINFTNTSVNATSYLWSFGPTGATSTQINPQYTYLNPGTYTVTLAATNSNTGCTAERTQVIDVSNTAANFSADVTSGCAPLQVRFTSTSTGTGLTYNWSFGPLGATSTQQNPTYTYTTQGQYTVRLTVTDVNGCQVTETKTAYISVSDVTPEFIALSTTGCLPESGNPSPIIQFQNQSTTSGGTTIQSWQWDFGNGTQSFSLPGNPPPATINRAYNTAGSYTVSLTVTTSLGCTRTISKPQYIRVNQPVANFSTDYNLYCPNQPVQFVNTSTGQGLTYRWDFGDPSSGVNNTSTAAQPTHAYQDTGYYTISLIVIDNGGCRDTLVRPDLFYIGLPDLDFFALDTFRYCPPFLVNFTNLTSYDTLNVTRYEWDFGDGTGAVNVQNPSKVYNSAGLFEVKVVVTFENGCVDSLAINNYINIGGAVGNMTLSTDSACKDDCILIRANASGAISLFWIFDDGEVGSFGDTVTHCYLTPGLFVPSVILTDTQQPVCSYTLFYNDTLVIDSVNTFFVTNLNDTVCSFSPIQFIDSSSAFLVDSIVRWEWDFGDGGTSSLQNPVYSFSNPGTNTVTLTSYSVLGCSNTYSRDIWVIRRPDGDFVISDTIGCDSLLATYTDASIQGDFPIVSWQWNFGDLAVLSDTANTQGPHSYFYNLLGSYTPRLIVRDAYGCRDTVDKVINVYQIPTGINGADTIQICFRDSVVLNGTPGYATYDWTPGLYLNDSTIAQPTAYATDTITYILVTTDFSTCQSTDTVTLIVLPLPPLSLNPYPDTNICLGDTVQLIANGSIQYSWSPPVEISNTTIANPIVYPTNSRYYKVVTTDSFGCQSFDSVRVIINRFFPEFAGERSCLGTPADFVSVSATSDRPIVRYYWDFGDNTTIADTSVGRITQYTYSDSGSYQVTLVLFDNIGCSDTLVKTVRVDFPPNAFAGNDTLICFGASAQLYSGGGVDSVYWTPATGIDNPFTFNPIVTPNQTTTYVAHVTNGVCPFDTATVRVVVKPLPYVKSIDDRIINKGVTIELTTITDLQNAISWNTVDTTISCLDCLNPTVTPSQPTLYIITVTDEFGCVNSDSVLLLVNQVCNDDIVFVPTAFTPNGDGSNDYLYARMFGAKELMFFRIFDRWGKLLFETNNPNIGWDGINRDNEKLITGVYVYAIEAVCFNGEKVIKTGNVTLLK